MVNVHVYSHCVTPPNSSWYLFVLVMEARFTGTAFTIAEGGGTLEIVQGLLEDCGSLETTVDYTITFNTEAAASTVNVTDIVLPTADIFFRPTDTSLNKSLDFSLYIEDDCILEGTEAVQLNLDEVDPSQSMVGSPRTAILEIVDDDCKLMSMGRMVPVDYNITFMQLSQFVTTPEAVRLESVD